MLVAYLMMFSQIPYHEEQPIWHLFPIGVKHHIRLLLNPQQSIPLSHVNRCGITAKWWLVARIDLKHTV